MPSRPTSTLLFLRKTRYFARQRVADIFRTFLDVSVPGPNRICPTRASQVRDIQSNHHPCVSDLLEAAAQKYAQSIAVEFEGRSLTYAELNARANQLARVLS